MAGPGCWWKYIPDQERARRLRQWRKAWILAQFQRRPVKIILLVILNLLICSVPWWIGLQSLAVLALLPLVVVPAVGYLAYWLTWKEFHR